ncbi:MAG TPA: DUF4184 family protein [Steroidobacteraceae bacterium]|nr:DUF4184 family protein [Steroidobacteraceae bacterium]
MPYTISHAAVVLPFSRLLVRWRLLSAVVVGAMVPDFGLFLPWRIQRFETHSAWALLAFCLPVGLAGYWTFQYVIKTPLLEVLPEGAYARWRPFSSPADFFSIRQWLLAAVGVLAGAVSHLVWDAFTHETGRGVRMIPWLEDPVMDIGSHHLIAFRLLQDGSSLVGLAIVLVFVCYGLRRGREFPVPSRPLRLEERRVWALTYAAGALALSAAWLLWARAGEPAPHSYKAFANGIAVAALRGLATAFLATSLALRWRLRALRSL